MSTLSQRDAKTIETEAFWLFGRLSVFLVFGKITGLWEWSQRAPVTCRGLRRCDSGRRCGWSPITPLTRPKAGQLPVTGAARPGKESSDLEVTYAQGLFYHRWLGSWRTP
jgi:hypothetical protein